MAEELDSKSRCCQFESDRRYHTTNNQMNTNKGGTGRAKHRQAFGHDIVSSHVKLAVSREVNKEKKKPNKPEVFDSVKDLMKNKKSRK